jgi:predicted RNase H-like HicB family nuclease
MSETLAQRTLHYTSIYEPAEEGGYIVSVPLLPGLVTQGDTFEEAQMMVKDAIEAYLSTLVAEGMAIPRETQPSIMAQVAVAEPTV